jgi:P-type Ca2+ transporter type 2C
MKRNPRPSDEPLLGRPEWMRIAWVGALEGSVVLGLYFFTARNSDVSSARNVAFTTLVFSQLWRSFSARSISRIFWEVGPLSNPWLFLVVIATAFLQVSLHFMPLTQKAFGLAPLSPEHLTVILPLSLIAVTVIETIKLVKRRTS